MLELELDRYGIEITDVELKSAIKSALDHGIPVLGHRKEAVKNEMQAAGQFDQSSYAAALEAIQREEIALRGGIESEAQIQIGLRKRRAALASQGLEQKAEAANMVAPTRPKVFVSYDTGELELATFIQNVLEKRLCQARRCSWPNETSNPDRILKKSCWSKNF